MRVSIITINRNNCEGLRRTMASVLAQTTANFEYIVIDGASTDGSADAIRACADRLAHWVSEPDGGIYEAMNKGIAAAGGDYCIFMNSGDTFHAPDVLAQCLPRLCDKDFYVGDMQQTGTGHRLIKAPATVTAYYLANKFLSHQAAFIRTALLKARPYQTRYRVYADWEQMFYELIMRNASYERLPLTVADFDTTGISSSPETEARRALEHRAVLDSCLPPRLVEALTGRTRFEHKMRFALEKTPLRRDVKILRNVLKALPRDLWRSIRKRG